MAHNITYDRVIGPTLTTDVSDQTTTTFSVTSETAPTTVSARTYGNFFSQVSSPGDTTTTTPATATDTQSNVYVLVKEIKFANFALDIFNRNATTPNVTTTFTMTHQPSKHRITQCDEWYNIISTPEHVTSAIAASPVAQVDVGEFHVGQREWLVYAVLAIGGTANGDSVSISDGWNLLHDSGSNTSDGNDVRLITCYQIADKRKKITFTPVISTARVWGAVMFGAKQKGS